MDDRRPAFFTPVPTPREAEPMAGDKTLRLILGDQLNPLHSCFRKPSNDVVYTLMEVRQETDYVLHHV
jgi:hypothetical protein